MEYTHTWNAYTCPYSLLSWLFITPLVSPGSFIASQEARPRKSSHCLARRKPRLAYVNSSESKTHRFQPSTGHMFQGSQAGL